MQETFSRDEVIEILDKLWRQAIAYRMPKVCKHLVACDVLNVLETIGAAPPEEIVKAVVEADDASALAWVRGKPQIQTA